MGNEARCRCCLHWLPGTDDIDSHSSEAEMEVPNGDVANLV